MKRVQPFWPLRGLVRWSLVLAAAGVWLGRAQSELPPEVQDRLQRLSGLVEDLLASQAAQQKRIAALQEELQAVREQSLRLTDKLGERFVAREELRQLAEAIREVDRKREEDRRLILEEIKKLAQAPAGSAARPPSRPPASAPPRDPAATPAGPLKGYLYKVKPGDTLDAIARAYAQNGVKVTLDDVLKANPKLKPERLQVGQEVFIPDPDLK